MLAAVIICAFGAVLAFSLRATDIQSTHEGRVVDVARNMLGSGQYWVPMINGVPRLEKSPLVYWIVAGSGTIWGELNEFSARAPSVMVGMGCVLVTILLGRSMFNSTVGLIAGLVHISTFVYWRECRTAELDIYLTFFMSVSILACCRLVFNGSGKSGWFWVLLFWLSMGLGAAGKSIITVLPVLLACGLGTLVCRGKKNIEAKTGGLWLWQIIGVVMFLVMGGGWNVGMLVRFSELSETLWNKEVHEVLLDASSSRPMYYYLPGIFLWAFPASALVPAAMLVVASQRCRQYRREILFLLICVVVVVGSYSIWPGGKKKLEYILPMISGFAVLAGLVWSQLLIRQRQGKLNGGDRITIWSHSLLLLVCGLVGIGFSLVDEQGRWAVAALGAGIVGLSAISMAARNKRVGMLLWGTALGSLGAMIVNLIWIQPVLNEQISPRVFAEAVSKQGGEKGKVVFYRPGMASDPGTQASVAIRKEQGIPPLNFYLKYDVRYIVSEAELKDFFAKHRDGLIITGEKGLTGSQLNELKLRVLYRQDIHRPHMELTSERFPKSWQGRIDDVLQECAGKGMKYTLLVGKR